VTTVDDRLEHRVRIQAPPDVVYAFFTDPVRHVRWMGRSAVLDPRPGGIYQVEVNDTHTVVGEYVLLDPPTSVVFTWGFQGNPDAPPGCSKVTVTLTPDGGGTLLVLTHLGLPHPLLAGHDQGWTGYLGQLVGVHAAELPRT
jgi:uncharacterized protein YndB with AHSA1/START domain